MNNLSKKDWAIIGLFFALLLATSPLVGLVDETPLENSLPWAMGLLGIIGFILSIPASAVARLLRLYSIPDLNLISWLTAIIYSAILALLLAKYNSLRTKK